MIWIDQNATSSRKEASFCPFDQSGDFLEKFKKVKKYHFLSLDMLKTGVNYLQQTRQASGLRITLNSGGFLLSRGAT